MKSIKEGLLCSLSCLKSAVSGGTYWFLHRVSRLFSLQYWTYWYYSANVTIILPAQLLLANVLVGRSGWEKKATWQLLYWTASHSPAASTSPELKTLNYRLDWVFRPAHDVVQNQCADRLKSSAQAASKCTSKSLEHSHLESYLLLACELRTRPL